MIVDFVFFVGDIIDIQDILDVKFKIKIIYINKMSAEEKENTPNEYENEMKNIFMMIFL